MCINPIDENVVNCFYDHLRNEEKSAATCEKYLRDVRYFLRFANNRPLTKELVAAFKLNL